MRNAAVLALVSVACSRPAPTATAPANPAGPTLDDLTHAMWAEANVTPAPVADDGAFLRRVSLDLTGKLPSRQAAAAYLADSDPDKKRKLVDLLLAGEDYGEHWADIYLTVFGGHSLRPPALRESIHRWLVAAFATNERWDEMTREMITATGKVSENGALGFLVAFGAKGGSPEAVAGATARVFLGTQAQCAQCHDHPYDPRIKQDDFYGMVAFFARTDRVGRRSALARELLASPLFAEAAANHMWAILFGRGIVQPWDDLGGERDERPPLLPKLAADFRASGYDRRALLREIVLGDAYAGVDPR